MYKCNYTFSGKYGWYNFGDEITEQQYNRLPKDEMENFNKI